MSAFIENYHGIFLNNLWWGWALGGLFVFAAMGFVGAPLFLWSLCAVVALFGFGAPLWSVGVLLALAFIFNVKPIRAFLVSAPIMKFFKAFQIVPSISQTEREALDAGVVWIEGDLFSGKPDFNKLLKAPFPKLTPEEQAFVDGPVEELLSLFDEFEIWRKKKVPTEVWDFLRKKKFLGMIIPKKYGGLGFSANAHSAVIMKISSRSVPVTVTAMVPNSLGPAELLVHYGTEAQKDYYLPRLASGEEIPCFGLTEPTAGSDASGMRSEGVVFKGEDGKLYMKLNWNKRWITLAAVSTVIGLAFKLKDPENLLGKGTDPGITCALIPSQTKGVVIGRRHNPLEVPFYNCPTQGHDVVVPVDAIIGGADMAGKGWSMLMESLAAGRGISLPAQSMGIGKIVTRLVTAHASVRKQFGLPIGKFEGIEEPLARIAGLTYMLESFGKLTLGGLDLGLKPPVVTAVAKYNATELGRIIVNDGMDIMGGAAISRGPKNLISNFHIAGPIGITVEGANILTRTLMIFGQGALRAHPYAYQEVKAIEENNLMHFDRAFWGHIGHIVRNGFRSVLLSLTRGRLARSPVGGEVSRYYQKLSWASASFALMADIAMGTLGGSLKVKEKITGRFADILSYLYIGFAVLRRWEADGRRKEDLPFVHFSMQWSFNQMQQAFDGIFSNLKVPGLTWFFSGVLRMWSSLNSFENQISDSVTKKVSKTILENQEVRDRLTQGCYCPQDEKDPAGRLDMAYRVVKESEGIERKIKQAIKAKTLPKKRVNFLIDEAFEKGVITKDEHALISRAEQVRWDAIQVDDFSEEEFRGYPGGPEIEHGSRQSSVGSSQGAEGSISLAKRQID